MSNNNNKGKRSTNNSANYVPSLKGANPIKHTEADWWDEMCKAHGAENHWLKEKSNKKKN